jgi:hypothetical protein
MLAAELERVVEESSRKLFQIAKPPVRYFLLTDIMGMTNDDALVQQTYAECRRYPPRLRLLNALRDDGTWPISRQRRLAEERGPGPPVGWTYATMLRNLHDLSDYMTTPDEGHVTASLEKILSWQSKEGFIPGPTTDLFPLPHYNGLAMRSFVRFGMEYDDRVLKIVRWLSRTQRADGGWLIPYLEDVKYLPQYRDMPMKDFMNLLEKGNLVGYNPDDFRDVPSCIWTTMMVVRGLGQSFKLADSKAVARGADFVLNHFFKKNNHTAFLRSASNWTRLKYPTYNGSGLCALDLLTWLGYGSDDPRMEKPIRWLLGARSADGLWAQSDRPNPEKDQWISETAISVLSRYAQSLRHVPFGRDAEMLKLGC